MRTILTKKPFLAILFTSIMVVNLLSGEPIETKEKNLLRPQVGIGVLVVGENNTILVGKRLSSHGNGMWAPPGGHLEFGETPEECAKRELLEETGLVALEVHDGPWIDDGVKGDKHYISIFMIVTRFEGTPELLEPTKCSGWEWRSFEDLEEPIFPPLALFIKKFGSIDSYLLEARRR